MPFPDIHPALTQALQARGYQDPTPVQDAVLAAGSTKRDLLVSAQTGSGKTVAFGLAFAHDLLGGASSGSSSDDEAEKTEKPAMAKRLAPVRAPLALVIAPTRELALQVQNELTWLYAETGAQIAACIGGTDARREARALERGVHIVVGTPGRLCDHLSRGKLNLSALRVVVLDEADEMLDMGFREELEQLLDAAPADRRTLLFSATIAREIVSLARRYQKDAVRIDTASGQKQHADITYRCIVTAPHEVGRALVNILRYYEGVTAMVFCNTRLLVGQVQAGLLERGFASVAISGEMGQNERSRAIESLRSGVARVCVATDVAARGIDVPALGLVIHASMPSSAETLLHRSGRTGRAGRKGTSIIMVPFNQRRRAERLLVSAKIKAEWGAVPSMEEIATQDATRLLEDPRLIGESDEPSEDRKALVNQLVERFDAQHLAAALVGFYEEKFPKAEQIRPVSLEAPRGRERGLGGERNARSGSDGSYDSGAWFRLGVGRNEKADPKWLVPLICRLGGVQKRDIGSIQIQPNHTLFQISEEKLARFNACRVGADKDEVSIEPASAPEGGAGRSGGYGGRKSAGGPRAGGGGGGRFRREASRGEGREGRREGKREGFGGRKKSSGKPGGRTGERSSRSRS